MEKQEQVKKMAQDICRLGKPCEKCSAYPDACKALTYAERFYDANYRKQTENTVEVVRCKDCIKGHKKFIRHQEVVECQMYHHDDSRQYKYPMHYCAHGMRREEE